MTKFTRLGAALVDLEVVWKDRLLDAEALLAAGRNASAITMGLYALEIALKARICRRLDQLQLPKAFEIHDLNGLLLAGLERRLEGTSPSTLRGKTNWYLIQNFASRLDGLRYLPDERWSHEQVRRFLGWVQNPKDGVLPSLLKQL